MENSFKTINIPTLKDYITGTALFDDENERARQKVYRTLVDLKGFDKKDIKPREIIKFPDKRGLSIIDSVVLIDDKCLMIVRYGLSSIVTRHRSALAAARIYSGKHIPYVVVTNGEDADILDGKNGKILFQGMDGVPSKGMLEKLSKRSFEIVSDRQLDMEYKILYMFDVL